MTTERNVPWGRVIAGVLLGLLVLTPASMLAGAYFDKPVELAAVLFATAPVIGLTLALIRPTRALGIGVLVGVVLWWVVMVPVLSAWLGG